MGMVDAREDKEDTIAAVDSGQKRTRVSFNPGFLFCAPTNSTIFFFFKGCH